VIKFSFSTVNIVCCFYLHPSFLNFVVSGGQSFFFLMLMSSAKTGIVHSPVAFESVNVGSSVLGVDQSQTNIPSPFDLYHHDEHHLQRCPLRTLREFTSMHRTIVQVRT
jgi:hypothetical protein